MVKMGTVYWLASEPLEMPVTSGGKTRTETVVPEVCKHCALPIVSKPAMVRVFYINQEIEFVHLECIGVVQLRIEREQK